MRPGVLCFLLVALPAAAAPRLAVHPFSGPDAAAAEAEMVEALREAGGVDLIAPAATEGLLRALGSPRRGWRRKPGEVRRVLPRIGADLLLTGRLRREGGRTVAVILVLSSRTGRVVSATRVERGPTGFAVSAPRIARRLRDLAFAALGISLPPAAVAAVPPAPPVAKPVAPTSVAPPALTRAPEPAPAPVPETTLRARVHLPPERQSIAVDVGLAWSSFSSSSSMGLVGLVGLTLYPGAGGEGWTRDLGLDLSFESSLVFQDKTDAAGTQALRYRRVHAGLRYRWPLGDHEVHALLAYDYRATDFFGDLRGHLLSLGAGGVLRFGDFRLSPFVRLWPAGGYEGAREHRFGYGGGLRIYARISGAALGVFARAERFLTGSSSDDTVLTAGAFAGYRY